jgi:hypothetical protein
VLRHLDRASELKQAVPQGTARIHGADDEIRTRDIDDEHSVALGATVSGADDEIRTRDIDLGKVALYQLSYIRRPV